MPSPRQLRKADFLRGWIAKTIKATQGRFTLTMIEDNVVTIVCQDRPFWYVAGVKEKAEREFGDSAFELVERA